MTRDKRPDVLSMASSWPLWGLYLGLISYLGKMSRISMASPMVWMRMSPRVQAFEHLAPCCCYYLERLRRYGFDGSTFLLQRALRFEPVLSVHLSVVITTIYPPTSSAACPFPVSTVPALLPGFPWCPAIAKASSSSSAFGHNALSYWKSSWECFPCFSFIYLDACCYIQSWLAFIESWTLWLLPFHTFHDIYKT